MGLILAFAAIIIVLLACGCCYFALGWKREAERHEQTREHFAAALSVKRDGTDGDTPPPGTRKPIRKARDGAAGLALAAIATTTWLAHHAPGKIALASLILAATTTLFIVVTQPAHTPSVHRRPGIHKILKPPPTGRTTVPSTAAPSAMAAPVATSSAVSVGDVASSGPLATASPSATVTPPPTTTGSVLPTPTTPPVTPVTPTGTCILQLDVLRLVEACVN